MIREKADAAFEPQAADETTALPTNAPEGEGEEPGGKPPMPLGKKLAIAAVCVAVAAVVIVAAALATCSPGGQEAAVQISVQQQAQDQQQSPAQQGAQAAQGQQGQAAGQNSAATSSGAATGAAGAQSSGSKASDGSSSSSSSKGGSSSSAGSSSGPSSSGSSSSKPAHAHHWVAQYKTMHHDAVTQEADVCECGLVNPGRDHVVSNKHSTTVKEVVVQEAYDEKVLTGYKCSGCGKTKGA